MSRKFASWEEEQDWVQEHCVEGTPTVSINDLEEYIEDVVDRGLWSPVCVECGDKITDGVEVDFQDFLECQCCGTLHKIGDL